jgi:hypothetical protein
MAVYTHRATAVSARPGRREAPVGCALVTLLLCATGCGGRSPSGGEPLKYLPGDASMVLTVNVARLRQTQFKDRLLALRDRSEPLRKAWESLAQKAGLDPLRDVDAVVAGLPYQPSSSELGVVIVGRFNQAGVLSWFKGREGAKVREEKHGTRTFYADDDHNYYVSFVDSKTLFFASKDWIRKMLDLADGKGQAVRSKPEMTDLLNRARGNQVVSLVARFPEELRQRAKESGSSFSGVNAIVGTIDFAAGMELDFRADAETAKEASQLTDKFNEAMRELRDSPMLGALALTPLLKDVTAAAEGKVFHLRATLPQQQLDDLIKKVEELIKSRMGDLPQLRVPGPEPDALGGPGTKEPGAPKEPSGAKEPGGAAEEPKAAPEGDLPQLKLAPPGAKREKRRPGLLNP